jgi:RasGEF N-terminal motif
MACKKEKILSIITDPTFDDEKFTNIIFLTFRNFCTAEEMLAHLLNTFYATVDSSSSAYHQELFQKYRVPAQLKVIKVLHNWIEHHWHDFGLDSKLRGTLNSFLYILTANPEGEYTEVSRGLVFVADIQVTIATDQ